MDVSTPLQSTALPTELSKDARQSNHLISIINMAQPQLQLRPLYAGAHSRVLHSQTEFLSDRLNVSQPESGDNLRLSAAGVDIVILLGHVDHEEVV